MSDLEMETKEAWAACFDRAVAAQAEAKFPDEVELEVTNYNKESPHRLSDEALILCIDMADLYRQPWYHCHKELGVDYPELKLYNSFVDSTFSLSDLATRELPVPPSLFDSFMVKGSLTLIHAGAGVGKTPFAMTLCNSMLRNRGFLGWEAGTEAANRVLYMDGELPLWLFKQRALSCFDVQSLNDVQMFSAAHWYNAGNSGLDLSKPHIQDKVSDIIEQSGADVVVLDNRSNFYHGKENENDEAHELNRFLIKVRESGKTVIINHHQGKGGGFRGASAIIDSMDNVISLTRNSNEEGEPINDEITINFEKSRFGWPRQSTTKARLCAVGPNFWFKQL
jgi:hypothetical protein